MSTFKEWFESWGGPGSGHHGHKGVPGSRGGSVPGAGGASSSDESLGALAARNQLALPSAPKQFGSVEEARAWADKASIRVIGNSMYEAIEIEALSTLRDLSEEFGKHVSAISFGGEQSSYNRSDWRINIDNNPWRGTEGTQKYMEGELHTLHPASPLRSLYEKHLEVIKSGKLVDFHSMYSFPNNRRVEATVRHEFGHAAHQAFDNGSSSEERGFYKMHEDTWSGKENRYTWKETYGTTRRSLDTWNECVAESFTLWSVGQPIAPDMQKAMDTLVRGK